MPELMKGHHWSDRFTTDRKTKQQVLRFEYPVYVEPKIDDIRVHFKMVFDHVTKRPLFTEALSYAGKPLHNLELVAAKVHDILLRNGLTELDCGFECHGNFNDSYRYVRSKAVPEDLEGKPVKLILFDAPDLAERTYVERRTLIEYLGMQLRTMHGLNALPPAQYLASTEEQVDRLYRVFRDSGFEGAMAKLPNSVYERGKRTYSWLKMKPEETYDGKIVRINRAHALDGTPHDRAGSITVEVDLPNGDTATADPSGLGHSLAADMWDNPGKYLGQWVEFRCMERDRAGGFRHPIFIRLREAKA